MNRARTFLFPKIVVKLSFHFISSKVGTLLILNTTKMSFKHIFSVVNSHWNELTPIRYQFEEKAADSFWLWFDSTFLWQVKVGRSGTFYLCLQNSGAETFSLQQSSIHPAANFTGGSIRGNGAFLSLWKNNLGFINRT